MASIKFTGHCMKCKDKRRVDTDGKVKLTTNGRRMAQGPCPECGTTISKFLPNKKD